MDLGFLLRSIWYLDLLVLAGLLMRFGYLRLHRHYPALGCYLAIDLVGGVLGIGLGISSAAYYWTYFALNVVLGATLLPMMCREMFVELYWYHPGLMGVTQHTFKRSLFASSAVTLFVAPVALVHWGERDFTCWQFLFVEIRRCLNIGMVVFIILMWNLLRWVPIKIPRTVKAYSWSICMYLALCGALQTIVLIVHRLEISMMCNCALLILTFGFYGSLLLGLKTPEMRRAPFTFLPIDAQTVAQLSSISDFLGRVEEAQRRARASALERIPVYALTRAFREPTIRWPIRWRIAELWSELVDRVRYLKTTKEFRNERLPR